MHRSRTPVIKPILEAANVTVVVAIFDALAEVRACIESVLTHTSRPYRLLLIDDHSTDPEVVPALEEYAIANPHIDLILNPANRGYTAVINQGSRSESGDVVLLNSDTVVTSGWIDKLADAAYGRDRVATVTPVSNAAGAFSVPESNVNLELPGDLDPAAMGELVERLSPRRRPEVPTGNGFCMYVTRRAFEAVGYFDEVNFPRGYGEENDFCMRARSAGFLNLVDDATFIYHRRGASFGEKRNPLLAAARERLGTLHPSYKPSVTKFLAEDPLEELRARLRPAIEALSTSANASGPKPAILFVLHAGGGGTPATNADLATALSDEFRCLILTCDRDSWSLLEQGSSLEALERFEFDKPWQGHEALSRDRLACFRRICTRYGISLVHIRHLLGSGEGIIAEAKELDLPVVFSFHDFYTVCPTLHLLDETGEFCGGHCTAGEGDCPVLPNWFGGLPPLKHRFVHVWRERLASELRHCDAFVTTSASAHDVVTENFPFLGDRTFPIIEHGRDSSQFESMSVPPVGDRVRVVCPGALGRNKGVDLISELMQLDLAQGPRFEFHFVGRLARAFTPDRWGGFLHGPYDRDSFASVLGGIEPSFALIASTWPETYCHTLTESWMCGVPALVADIGTLRERVRRDGGGWLLDYTNARRWYEGMLSLGLDDWNEKRAEIASMEFPSVGAMAGEYRDLYRGLLSPNRELTTVPAAAT